ncbi:RepA [Sporobolus striate mosaic virus 1]|uniref:Replication-associated protein n=1 Tax=Sporobolus striate mosaic virus 1 TaxID=1302849 RepID=J7FG57_9GEMI|nr:RepA [Sporobolus striate mosaic virus 1]AFN80715.1 RepA [Sporobolus striate mosaic virus 1]
MSGPSRPPSPFAISSSDEESVDGFHFRGKNIFLTYSRCEIDPALITDALWDKFSSHKPLYILSVRELHQDSGFHVHCLVQLTDQYRSRDSSFADLGGNHPNIQTVRSATKVKEYILKEPVSQSARGKFVAPGGRPPKHTDRRRSDSAVKDERMRYILRTATTRDDYLGMVRKSFPFEWATRLAQFEYSASKLFPDITPQYQSQYQTTDLTCHENLLDWYQENLQCYIVSPFAYSCLHPAEDAESDLKWMADVTRTEQGAGNPSTSADQLVPVRNLGPGC